MTRAEGDTTTPSDELRDRGAADLIARCGEERARVLRRRLVFYCGAVATLLFSSLSGHYTEWVSAQPEARPILRAKLPWELLQDRLLVLIFGATLVSLLLRLPTRRGVVGQAPDGGRVRRVAGVRGRHQPHDARRGAGRDLRARRRGLGGVHRHHRRRAAVLARDGADPDEVA